MSKTPWILGGILLVIALVGAYLLVHRSTTDSQEQTSGNAAVGANGVSEIITYTDAGFSPASLRITPGTTITWSNQTSGQLWVAEPAAANDDCDDAPNPSHFNECASVGQGGTYSYTFTTPGTVKYIDLLKPNHTATITVTGDAPAAGHLNPNAQPQ